MPGCRRVAKRSGVPASTLRFYEEEGLIRSMGRRGLRRVFDAGVLERLALISLGAAAGFSLDEIARMFGPDGRPRIDRNLLAAKAKELDATIRKLTAMRDGLRHGRLPGAESHGVPHVPAAAARRRHGCHRRAEEENTLAAAAATMKGHRSSTPFSLDALSPSAADAPMLPGFAP